MQGSIHAPDFPGAICPKVNCHLIAVVLGHFASTHQHDKEATFFRSWIQGTLKTSHKKKSPQLKNSLKLLSVLSSEWMNNFLKWKNFHNYMHVPICQWPTRLQSHRLGCFSRYSSLWISEWPETKVGKHKNCSCPSSTADKPRSCRVPSNQGQQ